MSTKININLISEYRQTHHLTVKEFCKQCKVSLSTYYRIIRGSDFNLIFLFRIAKIINVPVHLFFK